MVVSNQYAVGYLAAAGRAVWGKGTEAFKAWFEHAAQQRSQSPSAQRLLAL